MTGKAWSIMLMLMIIMLAGCSSSGTERIKLAFSVKDDFGTFVEKTSSLADWIEARTGIPTEIFPVEDESAALAALASGDATAGFLDGGAAWIGWKTFGLEAIAADQNSDGRTAYTAVAWVRASDIRSVEDLRGRVSCHTGELKSAGMLMPMGYLVRNGYIDASGVPDDVSSIKLLREGFFSNPQVGGDYIGAFQCLSEGRGEVAFVKDSTFDDFCSGEQKKEWCLPREQYRILVEFGEVPSHPVMVSPSLDAGTRGKLLDALIALNVDEEGRAILKEVLRTPGIAVVSTEEHLGSYGSVISALPGIRSHVLAEARN
ncbi:PhnD/SsuA/transferrin family substrate-binding protein [Candidatus Woesearchaeota archaeon]|nr:PhnD/SsuA/transferrin family substrate-binding protein [Candidatus Woesearchaeota archaeon]